MANNFFGAVGISGGSDGYLDNIDGGNLADGDGALVINTATNQGTVFVLDADSATAQVVPTIIQPDANAGDRRWLMRGWEGTEYSLYEPGTVNLMTWKMSSGNVIFDHTYDTGTLTFKGENTGDSTMLVMDPAGAVDLYYAGSKKLETVTGGVTVTGALTATSLVGTVNIDLSTSTLTGTLAEFNTALSDENFVSIGGTETLTSKTLTSPIINTIQTAAGKSGIINIEDGAVTLLYSEGTRFATSASGATVTGALTTTGAVITNLIETAAGKTGAVFTEDGPTELYYAGTKALNTRSGGIDIWSTDAKQYGSWVDTDGDVINKMYTDARTWSLRGDDNANSITAQDGGAVSLYHAGTKALSTTTAGAAIYDTSGASANLDFYSDAAAYLGGIVAEASSVALYTSVPELILRGNLNGAVELYYDGSKKFETNASGVSIGLCTQTFVSERFFIDNYSVSGEVLIRGNDSASSLKTMIQGDPDGAVDLYHAGTKALSTTTAGAAIYDTSGASANLDFYSDAAAYLGGIVAEASSVALYTSVPELILRGNLNGAVDLYYNGSKALETLSNGISIANAGTASTWIYSSNNEQRIKSVVAGEPLVLKGENLSNSSKSLFKGDPDGAAELYYAGAKTLETVAEGISVQDTSGDDTVVSLKDSLGVTMSSIYSKTEQTDYRIGPANATAMSAIVGGATELYYAGVVSACTNAAGLIVKDTSGASPVLTFQDDAGTDHSRIVSAATETHIKLWDGVSAFETGWQSNLNSSTDLYYAGVKYFGTVSTGVAVYDGANYCDWLITGGHTYITNRDNGGRIYLEANDNSSVLKTLFSGDPDGSAKLYYVGVREAETISDGFQINNGVLKVPSMKSGATQVAASAAANEVWKTASHATLPDNVLMIGV